jgi:hypothetical protein
MPPSSCTSRQVWSVNYTFLAIISLLGRPQSPRRLAAPQLRLSGAFVFTVVSCIEDIHPVSPLRCLALARSYSTT